MELSKPAVRRDTNYTWQRQGIVTESLVATCIWLFSLARDFNLSSFKVLSFQTLGIFPQFNTKHAHVHERPYNTQILHNSFNRVLIHTSDIWPPLYSRYTRYIADTIPIHADVSYIAMQVLCHHIGRQNLCDIFIGVAYKTNQSKKVSKHYPCVQALSNTSGRITQFSTQNFFCLKEKKLGW